MGFHRKIKRWTRVASLVVLLILGTSGCARSSLGIRGMSGLGSTLTSRNPSAVSDSEVYVDVVDSAVFWEYPRDPIATHPTSGVEIAFRGGRVMGAVVQRVHEDFDPNVNDREFRFSICGVINPSAKQKVSKKKEMAPVDIFAAAPPIKKTSAAEKSRDEGEEENKENPWEDIERRLASKMYRCLRVPLDGEPNILSKEARRGYRLAREYKVPIVFNYTDPNFDRIEYSEKLKRRLHLVIKRFRDLKFVFSHLGGPYYSDVAQWMKESVNIYADTSSLLMGDPTGYTRNELLEKVLTRVETFTAFPDRLLFASGWPATYLGEYVDILRVAIPQDQWNLVFYRNAIGVFGLDLDPNHPNVSFGGASQQLIGSNLLPKKPTPPMNLRVVANVPSPSEKETSNGKEPQTQPQPSVKARPIVSPPKSKPPGDQSKLSFPFKKTKPKKEGQSPDALLPPLRKLGSESASKAKKKSASPEKKKKEASKKSKSSRRAKEIKKPHPKESKKKAVKASKKKDQQKDDATTKSRSSASKSGPNP